MAKFPEPPPRGGLAARLPPEDEVLPTGTLLWRIHFLGGRYPTAWNEFRAWGPVSHVRYDHHLLPPQFQARRILYAAADPEGILTCFTETFQKDRVIDRLRASPWLVGFETVRPLRLLDLRGTWPTRAGASQAMNSGRRDRSRRWSQRIYEDYPTLEGLYYASSMNANNPALALYERAGSALPPAPIFQRALGDPLMDPIVYLAADRFQYDIGP